MVFQAHRGVSSEYPENTMPAFAAAVRQGYEVIELDVEATKDLKFVLLHDSTINRTARHQNGDLLSETVKISDITYHEALEYDFGAWRSKEFSGTRIALFEDVLEFARRSGVTLKIDNKHQRFNDEQRAAFFDILRTYQDVACLTCSRVEEIKRAANEFQQMHFHYDGPVTAEILECLSEVLPKERLTVWLPHKNPNTSWVKSGFATEELSILVKQYARLGIWLLTIIDQLDEAIKLGAEIIETNGQLKPDAKERR